MSKILFKKLTKNEIMYSWLSSYFFYRTLWMKLLNLLENLKRSEWQNKEGGKDAGGRKSQIRRSDSDWWRSRKWWAGGRGLTKGLCSLRRREGRPWFGRLPFGRVNSDPAQRGSNKRSKLKGQRSERGRDTRAKRDREKERGGGKGEKGVWQKLRQL